MNSYTDEFYESLLIGARNSAREIVPLVNRLIQPHSVIDVGCGRGTWLAVFSAEGVEDVWGIDGDWVNKQQLEIPTERFLVADLAKPFRLPRRFDLAVSLEVAEHLPAASAGDFVHSLTVLADVLLFSAAIPYQGGYHHLNEQWPAYWADLFGAHGYVGVDAIRQVVWQNDNVAWWYAQNTLLYVKAERFDSYPLLRQSIAPGSMGTVLPLVHPKKYLSVMQG